MTISSAVRSPTTHTSPASYCGSMTTDRRRVTILSTISAGVSVARPASTCRRCLPTASATASDSRWIRGPASCGNRKTATMPSTKSTASKPATTAAGYRPWVRCRALPSSRRSKRDPTFPGGLQQVRWPPTNIADSPTEARARMVDLAGSHYGEPQFSWKFATAPAAIGFLEGRSLGRKYQGDLFVGASIPVLEGGYLFRFDLTNNRQRLAWSDPVLADLVADNEAKHSGVESESLLFGSALARAPTFKPVPAADCSSSRCPRAASTRCIARYPTTIDLRMSDPMSQVTR